MHPKKTKVTRKENIELAILMSITEEIVHVEHKQECK
jgi:hypothetical protein